MGLGGPAPASSISTPPKKNAPSFIASRPSRQHGHFDSRVVMVAHMPVVVLTGARALDGIVTNVLTTHVTITDVGQHVDVPEGAEHVDLTGYVLLPSAVEPHAHLDKAFLAELVVNETGDLYGAIAAMQASRH